MTGDLRLHGVHVTSSQCDDDADSFASHENQDLHSDAEESAGEPVVLLDGNGLAEGPEQKVIPQDDTNHPSDVDWETDMGKAWRDRTESSDLSGAELPSPPLWRSTRRKAGWNPNTYPGWPRSGWPQVGHFDQKSKSTKLLHIVLCYTPCVVAHGPELFWVAFLWLLLL